MKGRLGFRVIVTTLIVWQRDIDLDGDLDLVVGNEGPNKLHLNLNGDTEAAWTAAVGDFTTSTARRPVPHQFVMTREAKNIGSSGFSVEPLIVILSFAPNLVFAGHNSTQRMTK